MDTQRLKELYQQTILEHNRHPRQYGRLPDPTHTAEGYNPLCGDHLVLTMRLTPDGRIEEIRFEGDGCAISRASASLMAQTLKGKTVEDGLLLFDEFHRLVMHQLDPDKDPHHLGKLAVFSGVWQFPSRVKCATLAWHAFKGALENKDQVTTE